MTDFCSGGKLASRVHTASVWAGAKLAETNNSARQATPARPPGVAATAAVRRRGRLYVRVFPHDIYRPFVAGADDVFINILLAQFRIAVGEFRPFAVDHTVGRRDVPPAAYVVVQRV